MSYRPSLVLRQCPLTSGLATRMTEAGFKRACEAKLVQMIHMAALNSTNPHSVFCRECKGQNRPVELEIISRDEEISMAKVSPVKEYKMPQELGKLLRPMSQAEAEGMTISGLVKFWRRPVIKYSAKSACPCCGVVHQLKACGVCSGCHKKATGLELLAHLAKRVNGGVGRGRPVGWRKVEKAAAPAPETDIVAIDPAEQKGFSAGDQLAYETTRLIEERDCFADTVADVTMALKAGDGENLTTIALQRMVDLADAREQIKHLRGILGELQGEEIQEQACPADIVAKWSALPVPTGYEALTAVLEMAIDQAANGKGHERHADGRPFTDQPIMRETQAVGLGFPAGQARKKILEAVRCCENNPERAVADLLGAINYTAAMVIAIQAAAGLSA